MLLCRFPLSAGTSGEWHVFFSSDSSCITAFQTSSLMTRVQQYNSTTGERLFRNAVHDADLHAELKLFGRVHSCMISNSAICQWPRLRDAELQQGYLSITPLNEGHTSNPSGDIYRVLPNGAEFLLTIDDHFRWEHLEQLEGTHLFLASAQYGMIILEIPKSAECHGAAVEFRWFKTALLREGHVLPPNYVVI